LRFSGLRLAIFFISKISVRTFLGVEEAIVGHKDLEEEVANCGLISNAIRLYKVEKVKLFPVASPPNRCWIRSNAFENLPAGEKPLDALQKHNHIAALG
jgi:hypothetical protein